MDLISSLSSAVMPLFWLAAAITGVMVLEIWLTAPKNTFESRPQALRLRRTRSDTADLNRN